MELFHKQLFHLNEYLNEQRNFLWINLKEQDLPALVSRFGNTSNRACAHGNRTLTVLSTSCISKNTKVAFNI